MAANFPAIDPATITALNAGDERALERIFRASYDTVLARAKERLSGEDAAAPRLVSAIFRELWQERAGFHSTGEVEGFINEELRHRASAVRSRMAAVHRFEKTEGVQGANHHAPPSADQLWGEIVAALHAPAADSPTAAKARREHAKHEAAQHISRVAEKRSWKGPLALGLVAAAIGAGAFWYIGRISKESVVTQLLADAEPTAVTTRAGQLGSLTLGDGSAVRLGVESRLVSVADFGRRYRTARVGGTAAITVASGGELPLELRLSDAVLRATGGVLTVRDYSDENLRMIRAEGAPVELVVGDESRSIAAGTTVALDRAGVVRDATADEVAQAFAWTDGKLVLRDATVGTAVQQLWRWYGLAVNLGDESLKERRVSLEAPLESSQAAIAGVESGANVKFAWEGGKMMFRDAGMVKR